MSRYSGPQGRGASRRVRQEKRTEAEARDALTPPERRKQWRTATPEARLLLKVFGESV